MHDIVRAFSDHPLAAMTVCFVLLVVFYFIGKKLIKLALVLLIVALAIGGYYYFQYPDERPANVTEAMEKARGEAGRAVEKGKEVVEKGREFIGKGKEAVDMGREVAGKGKGVIDKGREIVETGKSFLDRVVERGRAFVGKVKKAAREIGKIFSEENQGSKK
jgi:hypothetical protein